jgi:FAD synthase
MKFIKLLIICCIFILFVSRKKYIENLVSSISGKVIKGDGTSRNYGYRTANMKLKKPMECGVFNGMSQHGKTTILSNGTNYVECHIHDFNKDIYGKTLKIKNIDYIDENDKYKDCLWAKQWI